MKKTRGLRVPAAALAMALAASLVLFVGGPASAATTFTVNSTGDENDLDFPGGAFDGSSDGKCDVTAFTTGDQCTLRAAIQEANLTTDQDTVNFNIPGSGVKTIEVGAPGYGSGNGVLPGIAQPLIIDGYTQPGSKKNDAAVGTNAVLRVQITDIGTGLGGSGLYVFAPGSVVRGLVVNGFDSAGIRAYGGVILEGNFIGTDPSGTQAAQSGRGVTLSGDDNEVGQATRASRNLISGNGWFGIGDFGTQSVIVNNLIGTARDGKSPLGNAESGVLVDGGSTCTIGLDSPEGANTIAFNGEDGVQVYDGAEKVAVARNSIFSNTGLGIDLLGAGENNITDVINPNDGPGDADTGANNLQNSPVLSSAITSTLRTTVKGTLNSTAGTAFVVRFFSNPGGTDEGKTYIGKKLVATDGTGHVDFTFTTDQRVAVGQAVTATATTLAGDTSEFSAPLAVNGPPVITPISPKPGSTTRDTTALVRARISDSATDLAKTNIRLFVDGRRKTTFAYDRAKDLLTYTTRPPLALGAHKVRIEATDAQGLKASRTWGFKVVR